MNQIPEELALVILGFLSFPDAVRAGLANKSIHALLQRAAPEVAGGWEHVPPLLPGESKLDHLAFVYARKSHLSAPSRILYMTCGGRPLQQESIPAVPGGGRAMCMQNIGHRWGGGQCFENVVQVAVAEIDFPSHELHSHALMLDADGGVWSCGNDAYGNLGVQLPRDCNLVNLVRRVNQLPACVSVTASYRSSAAVSSSGELFVWGVNEGDKLGLGVGLRVVTRPVRCLHLLQPAMHVAMGSKHMLVVTRVGGVYGCGSNASGQLGLRGYAFAILTPIDLPGRVSQAAAGNEHSLLLLASGQLLNAGTLYAGAAAVRSSCFSAAFPAAEGAAAAVQLPRFKYIQAVSGSTALISIHGALYVYGSNSWGNFTEPTRVECVVEPTKHCHLTPRRGVLLTGDSGECYRFLELGSRPKRVLESAGLGGMCVASLAASSKIFAALL
jgi:hypothetical protein